jgi:hypothetical protein
VVIISPALSQDHANKYGAAAVLGASNERTHMNEVSYWLELFDCKRVAT